MAEKNPFPVLTCPLCGRPDEAANMTAVAIEHAAEVWPKSVTLCQQCCLAVMDAVKRELDEYNQGVKDRGDTDLSLAERGDSEPGSNGAAAAEGVEHQPDHQGAGESGDEPSAPSANRSRAKSAHR
jgi:hypothetical protein